MITASDSVVIHASTAPKFLSEPLEVLDLRGNEARGKTGDKSASGKSIPRQPHLPNFAGALLPVWPLAKADCVRHGLKRASRKPSKNKRKSQGSKARKIRKASPRSCLLFRRSLKASGSRDGSAWELGKTRN